MIKTVDSEMVIKSVLPKVMAACRAGLVPIYNPEICAAVDDETIGPLGNRYVFRAEGIVDDEIEQRMTDLDEADRWQARREIKEQEEAKTQRLAQQPIGYRAEDP